MDAIVFDWDGTLADTLGGLYRANVAVMEAFGLPFDHDVYRRHYAPDWRVMYGRLGIPDHRLDEANALWHSAFDETDPILAFAGVRDGLVRLRSVGYDLGLVTAGVRRVVAPQLERLELAALLPVAVFGDDLPVHKPDPAPLQRALGELGLADRPDAAAYVGDAPDDMRMAIAVGAHAVGIASILGHPDELRAAGAHEVADSVVGWIDAILARYPRPAA
jgi:HAD superfamily hydrolase (TIGR01549 family)